MSISIVTNRQIFEYDIHSLFKAFYPWEDIEVKYFWDFDTDEGSVDAAYGLRNYSGFMVLYEPESVIRNIKSLSLKDGLVIRAESVALDAGKADDRIYLKNCTKRTIYRLLSALTGQELPWGTLTGIRPTKLSMSKLEEGLMEPAIKDLLKREYYVSDKKLGLSIEIAKRERAVIEASSGAKGFSLYIGIPFCPTTCLYCSFTSFPIASWAKRTGEYLEALKKEIREVSGLFKGRKLDSLYIGGGTPTTLTPSELSGLADVLGESFDIGGLMEFSVEAGRPDSISSEKLATLKDIGATRISINPQTMNEETLRLIGRRHTVSQVLESFKMARGAGFDNINMDLILGLPGEDISMVRHTFEEIEKLSPDSVTVHSMALKRAAGMAEFLKEHEEIKSINTPEMMELADNSLRRMGLLPYYLYRQKNMAGNLENVGYASPGKYGVYNILMMEEVQDIVALGAGTVTKRVYFNKDTGEPTGIIERCDNVKDPAMYIERIDEMIERKRRLFA